MAKKTRIDKTRASRDGHEFHEAWTARKAMQLFWPHSDLIGISVEGLAPDDQARASAAAVEVADVALYFGRVPSFAHGARKVVTQFKYSIADKDTAFRASNAKKTIAKFAATYKDYKRKYGAASVSERLSFSLITNQPISESLTAAIDAIAKGTSLAGDARTQGDQFIAAAGLTGKPLAEFAAKVSILGRSGGLRATKTDLENLLVDWSATADPLASERLGRIRDVVREKAGYAGTGRNLITRPDLLAALKISDAADLLPCEPRLVDVGPVVEREQLADALQRIDAATRPLLIHAAGGVGKTVFMESLGRKLEECNEVVLFDCFGGGAYRSLEDARHLPKQGLIHIANTLSFRGLCDPMLPDSQDQQALMRTFRRRLEQSVRTMSRVTPGRRLVLILDAIDNAEIAARQRSEDAFPVKLLESLDNTPIDGVTVIASCRSHRKPDTYAKYDEYELRTFTPAETRAFLRTRLKNVADMEVKVAQARSDGNARVLDYLLRSGRGLLDTSEIDKPLALTDLIQEQITDALNAAVQRGCDQRDIDAFLAGLAVLPPPVPLGEYAGAHGIETAEVESFASDLAPLIERTNQGLTFKDEPTETLVRERYASSKGPLKRLASNLLARQEQSVYAARALPGLLHELNDTERLFELAFDDRMPASVTSTVGRRNIRYSRLKAATLHAALRADHDKLVRLLVELSAIAAVDQRGADYILENPDLVVAAQDEDASRRLFETRSGWPGARHARLVIANVLRGESDEAHRHAFAAHEWLEHARRTTTEPPNRDERPEERDIAAIPFFLMTHGRVERASAYLSGWRDWYGFEICEHIFKYAHYARTIGVLSDRRFNTFIASLTSVGHLAAALAFCQFPKVTAAPLVRTLARRCRSGPALDLPAISSRERAYHIEDGLRKAAALALTLGLQKEAADISRRAPHERPRLWSFRDAFHTRDVFAFIYRVALLAALGRKDIHDTDILPAELARVCARIPRRLTGEAFRKRAREAVSKLPRRPRNPQEGVPVDPNAISYEESDSANRFLNTRLEPLLELTRALSAALGASSTDINKRFLKLVNAWESSRKSTDHYRAEAFDYFFDSLGLQAARFVLWARRDLKQDSVRRFLDVVHAHGASPANLTMIVAILAHRQRLQALAGSEALKARQLIHAEDDVTQRATLFSELARAMLPADPDEAAHYFREGLEQMDAIGSGDSDFTNELLLFASTIKGAELDERDFHTLSNVAELNLGEEPGKFPWGAYGRGLAAVAGLRGLAKLCRWDDRSRISLANTLLPYLIGLLEHGKIAARDALALNRLADPVDYFYSGTQEFADAIRRQAGPDPEVITALIEQYRDDNPGTWSDVTTAKLAGLANEALGPSSDLARLLAEAGPHHRHVIDVRNEQSNYRSDRDAMRHRLRDNDRANRKALAAIVARTDPAIEASLVQAITDFNALGNLYDLKDGFFSALRAKVDYADRGDYLRHVGALEHLFFHWKFAELQQAKNAWAQSSASLGTVFRSLAIPLITLHADDLISFGRVSTSTIMGIAELTGLPMTSLVLELVKVFARPGSAIPGPAWLAFASLISTQAADAQVRMALSRLLRSDAATLANNVVDGVWMKGLYPDSDFPEVASGLIWRNLGAPDAATRWRAAHAMRDFAAFGNWRVIDSLVTKWRTATGGSFQAQELQFYYLHARLWLLIGLARLAKDHPAQVAKYKDELWAITSETAQPHVLMRHFAADALLACVDGGGLTLTDDETVFLSCIDASPHVPVEEETALRGDFYRGRPDGVPKPSFEFHLDYDFHKLDVDGLARVFGKSCWEVADMISDIVHSIDSGMTSMYESGGRERHSRHMPHGLTSKFHGYGQYLGWHALFVAAGQLLASSSVTRDSWRDDPWPDWLGGALLTRQDGFWLSDGTDPTPLDTRAILLEQRKGGLAVTGKRDALLALAGIAGSRVGNELVVEGRWFSADHIEVDISSALIAPAKARLLARRLLREEPMIAWLPAFQLGEEDDDYLRTDKKDYVPWIVCPSGESRLDEHDPYGASVANHRPRLGRDYSAQCKLACDDPFHRVWRDSRRTVSLRAEAWGRDAQEREDGSHTGLRLFCRSSVLKKILAARQMELLLMIKLQRYEKLYDSDRRYTHSVAAVRIDRSLNVEYFKGKTNHIFKPPY